MSSIIRKHNVFSLALHPLLYLLEWSYAHLVFLIFYLSLPFFISLSFCSLFLYFDILSSFFSLLANRLSVSGLLFHASVSFAASKNIIVIAFASISLWIFACKQNFNVILMWYWVEHACLIDQLKKSPPIIFQTLISHL